MPGRLCGALFPTLIAGLVTAVHPSAQSGGPPGDVTFAKDIAPILQRSCQQCHRPDGVAPMALVSYEDVRPWAKAMKMRTSLGPHAGVMPPWFVEKDPAFRGSRTDRPLDPERL